MARVTKINVGGTNYDIAHEGELKNSGFEVVTELPTTGLFEGREVVYQGKKYVYSSGWKEEITANTMYEDKLLYNKGTVLPGLSVFDNMMLPSRRANVYAFTKPDAISFEYSQDAGVTWLPYEVSDLNKQKFCTFGGMGIVCGGPDVTVGNVAYRLRVNLFPKVNNISVFHKLFLSFIYGSALNRWLTVKALRKNQDDVAANYVSLIDRGVIAGDIGMVAVNLGDVNLINDYSKVIIEIGYDNVGSGKGLVITGLSMFASYASPSNYLARYDSMFFYDINKTSYFEGRVSSKEVINFDINNIEPTQTGNVTKTSTWLWQYLVQGVNWLRDNKANLSEYNNKLDKRSYNQVYTNCGYTNIVSSTTGALIIELPFAPTNDTNNSMTYIELNVYSHRKGCSKYIIGVYSYSSSSSYEWSVYSYMGYNYFSKISFGRRTDNNNIVVVLGDFTDLHKNEHFSISHIITGFYRNNDDTDQFLIYTDSTSSNYTALKDSSYIPQVISYNDLTDTPTLAAVATSGDYNDLLNRPAFSGSYNDLTDTPTIPRTFADLSGNVVDEISDGSIANSKLANSSITLNGITVSLGGQFGLPWQISWNSTLYKARIMGNWLQIYHNNQWVDTFYLLRQEPIQPILPTNVVQITSLDDLSWYNEQVSEYEVDSNTTISILNGTTKPATLLMNCLAEQLTINLYPISGKEYGKGSLDSLITDLQGKGFSVFVENDLDAIIGSGSDYLVRIKISKVPTFKAIIECYIAR